jgi:hypothetical protein
VTILISLPLSVPFALVSLLAARENFSIIYTSLGILILSASSRRTPSCRSITSNRCASRRVRRSEAILQGCEDRLHPDDDGGVMAGMISLALGGGAGRIAPHGGDRGDRRADRRLVLTVVTPVMYSVFDDLVHSRGGRGCSPCRRRSRRAFARPS